MRTQTATNQWPRIPWIAAFLAAAACNGERRDPQSPSSPGGAGATAKAGSETCPATRPAPEPLPGVEAEQLELGYWLERVGAEHDLDEVLLEPGELRNINASMKVPREGFYGQTDLLAAVDTGAMHDKITERLELLSGKFEAGEYVREDGSAIEPPAPPSPMPELEPRVRVALGHVAFHCAPFAQGYFAPELDLRLDKNRCSTAHPQEPVLVLARWPGDLLLARTRYTWGWIRADAPLSPELSDEHAARFVRGPHATVVDDAWAPAGAPTVPGGARLPRSDDGESVLIATEGAVRSAPASDDHLRSTARPLTRRAVLEEAFGYLGSPYGFGGAGGGRDCSRLLMDIFESFGLRLPRHSSWQAEAGSYSIDVSDASEDEKLRLLDAAAGRGIVLMQLPGHIMLYLGRAADGRPMALHSFAEYLEPCDGEEGETLFQVDRVQVSDLELGRGSSRGAFIERITRLAVLGAPPGPELGGVAELRPAAPVTRPDRDACRTAGDERLLVSPEKPDARHRLRVVATAPRDPGAVELALFDPDGERHAPDLVRLGGPPHGYVADVDKPVRGRWTAVLGDGDRVEACQSFYVRGRPEPVETGAPDGPTWTVRRQWSPAYEDLYAVFVERLFDYPVDEDLTWPNLHTVVRDAERNILHGHLGRDEDERIELIPDCADLPYTLRAYFAWKMGLPFGYHSCRRARPGRPPTCGRSEDNLMSRTSLGRDGDVEAFERFVHRRVRWTVHSSSGRTAPGDSNTDFYPVPLTRRALRPGTLFTDPYGHLLVVADWVPQAGERYGVLVGADAQPDGTVGRRRFWRGSFIFRPDTDSGGAGFKAFRPWRMSDGSLTTPDNDELRSRPIVPYSEAQYEGSVDDFYDTLNGLINPRPLDPRSVQVTLVDALEEAVSRRVTSIENGEEFMHERDFAPIEMPEGEAIFLTTGPWENFSTPSRDWRLLISMDTVLQFPDAVERRPAQYGVASGEVDEVVAELRQELTAELASRTFTYTRSDGSTWELTLEDVASRIEAFEMAYNPNDCIEIRWAAPEGSDERSTCDRHAPAGQRKRMREYRPWFSERRRPAN